MLRNESSLARSISPQFNRPLDPCIQGDEVVGPRCDRRIIAESHLQEFVSLAERKAIVKTLD